METNDWQYTRIVVNHLNAETRTKISRHLALSPSSSSSLNGGRVFVHEWVETEDRQIVGIGGDLQNNFVILQPDIEIGMFALVSDFDVLLAHLISPKIKKLVTKVQSFHKFKYRCNNFSVLDLMQNYQDLVNTDLCLVKICTKKFNDCIYVYNYFKYNPVAYKFINVPMFWTPTWMIMWERFLRFNAKNETISDYTLPSITDRWMDSNLDCWNGKAPTPNVLSFDIETVSDDPTRVPTGEARNDILMSVSIYDRQKKKCWCLVYLPLSNCQPEEIKSKILNEDTSWSTDYTDFNSPQVEIECFTTELDLLKRTMDLLTPTKFHYLLSYNGRFYDIKYLIYRCARYNLLEYMDRIVYRSGYSLALEQIHVDMFMVVKHKFGRGFANLKLDYVGKRILKIGKQSVDAVKLRFLFFHILRENRYPTAEEMHALGFPAVGEALYYNNYDTLLVDKLEATIHGVDHFKQFANSCRMGMSTTSVSVNRTSEPLWHLLTIQGLERQIFLTTLKSSDHTVKIPENGRCYGTTMNFDHLLADELLTLEANYDENGDKIVIREPITSRSMGFVKRKKIKYGGGANYNCGRFRVENIEAYDYVTAYPRALDLKNISDETALIMPASLILALSVNLTDEERKTFELWDYVTHKGFNKNDTAIMYHKFFQGTLNCGGTFPFTAEELSKRGTAPVIVIWMGRRGIISDIVHVNNLYRENVKRIRAFLDFLHDNVNERINMIHRQWLREVSSKQSIVFEQSPIIEEQLPIIEEFTPKDPYNFELPKHLIAFDEACQFTFNESYLQSLSLPRQAYELKLVCMGIELQQERYTSLYASSKTTNASIYGCMGSSLPGLGAILTCIMRTTIISAAKYLTNKKYKVYYIDTDSIFTKHPTNTNDCSSELNTLFPYTKLERKMLDAVCFECKKIYMLELLALNTVKYFQNNKGPVEWARFVNYVYSHRDVIFNTTDIANMFENYFTEYYERLNAMQEVNGDFLGMFTRTVTFHKLPETKTPIRMFHEYLRQNYPSLVNVSKHLVYYVFNGTKIEFRPSCAFKSRDQLCEVNIFKYLECMFKTICNLLGFILRKNNYPHYIAIHEKSIKLIMLRAFHNVYTRTFPNSMAATVSPTQAMLTMATQRLQMKKRKRTKDGDISAKLSEYRDLLVSINSSDDEDDVDFEVVEKLHSTDDTEMPLSMNL